MRYFITFFIFIFSIAAIAVDSFYDLSPHPRVIDGESYPRNGRTLFRGTTDAQMDLQKALRAMFGDSSAHVETLFFSTIKARLMNVSFPPAVELGSFIDSEIEKLKREKGGRLSENDAVVETKKLVDGTFQYLRNRNQLISQYVNYSSETFVDWPNNIVFSTLLAPLAGTYGERLLVFKENAPRTLDLNYWNKVHNNTWFIHTRDAAEFIAFGYMPPEDVIGYQIREGSPKSWHFVRYAFYKITHGGKTFVLVFSGLKLNGRKSTCIDRNPADQLYYHCDYQVGRMIFAPPPLSQERPQLLGVFVPCTDDGKSCAQAPSSEIQKYPVSTNGGGEEFKKLEIQFQRISLRYLCFACR